MDKEELIKEFKEIINKQKSCSSICEDHQLADHLLLKYIGDSEIKELFDEIDKRYS